MTENDSVYWKFSRCVLYSVDQQLIGVKCFRLMLMFSSRRLPFTI